MDNAEYIENYFSGTPDPEQVRRFGERIESDPDFADEVAFYLSAQTVAREMAGSEKKEQFREYYKKNLQEGTASASTSAGSGSGKTIRTKTASTIPLRKMMYYMSAAAVVAAISFVVYTYTQKVSPQELAAKYERENLTTLPVTMGGNTNAVQTGLRLYNEGKLQEAQWQFEKIIQGDSSMYSALEYAGLACLRLKNYDRAMYYFKQLETHKELYSNPALFYQAITLMERNQSGDVAHAKELLQQVVQHDLEGKEAAQIMINKW
jgi:hypothetical protein